MQEQKVLEAAETEICQIAVMVKDLNKAIEYYTDLGLGPFSVRTVTHPSAEVHGKKEYYQVKVALSQQGAVQYELVEYKEGHTIHKEFLDEKGEGLHHILFKVRDIEATLARFAQKGISVLQQDRFIGGGGVAYMDTEKIGGVIFEIVEFPPNYDPQKGLSYVDSSNK